MSRLNLILPDDLHARFKATCALNRKDMTEVLKEMIEEYVGKEQKKSKK